MNVRYNDGYDSSDYYRRRDRYDRGSYHHEAKDGVASKILLIVLAIICPPIAVFLMHGFRGEFWLSLLLAIIFYLPAQVFAVWLVMRR